MKTIAVGGMPGSGKSELVRGLIAAMESEAEAKANFGFGILNGQVFTYPEHEVYLLGKYEPGETFPGTDRLGMNVQPNAEQFLDHIQTAEKLDGRRRVVLFEGDRLFGSKFLTKCCNAGQVQILILSVTSDELQRRYAQRGSDQSGVWLKGRRTKVENAAATAEQLGAHILELSNETASDQIANLELISGMLK